MGRPVDSFRRGAVKTAARLLDKTGLSRALDAWNGRRGGVILAFHEISYARLRAQLTRVSRRYRFVSLTEFGERVAKGKSTEELAAITFDDGYGPTVESAARLARLRGWPMTFYLPTRYLDTGEPFWFQELDDLLGLARGGELEVDGLRLRLEGRRAVDAAATALRERFRSLGEPEEVDALLRRVRRAVTGRETRPGDLRPAAPVSWERVRELAARPELSFEAHSVNHLALSRVPEERLRREMEESRARIEEASGRRVLHFCYPFGGPPEIGRLAPRWAARLFRTATTMLRGRCRPDADPAMLPRVPLFERDTEAVLDLKLALAR